MKRIFSLMLAMVMAVSCLAISAAPAQAATKYTVSFSATYGQTEARKILGKINAMRTSSKDAWYWNADNTKKVQCKNLKKLKYDYALEKIAMQRAAEIAIYYGHGRPNAGEWHTIHSDFDYDWTIIGENIAAGFEDAAGVNKAWREDDMDYLGQGHRRNMLNSDFAAVGIAHLEFNGIHYWVEEFSGKANDTTSTTANNKKTGCSVSLASSRIIEKSVMTQPKLTMDVLESKTLPTTAKMKVTTSSWNSDMIVYAAIGTCTVEDTSIARISGKEVKGVKKGSTRIKTTAMGKTVYIPVTVTKNHTYTNKKVVAPTYVARGYTQYTCSDCGKVYKTDYKPKKVLPVPGGLTLTGKKGGFTAKYKKVSAATGYQVRYSTSSSFKSAKTVKVKGTSTLSKTVTGLTKGKRYYVKVRAYKVQNGKTAYSAWSGKKSVTTK